MPITSVTKDPDALTMTVVADFTVPVQRVWDAYLDPRQLERFWGPPTYPAQFTRHDGAAGGVSTYAMTGPEGDVSRGYWQWLAVEPASVVRGPRRLRPRRRLTQPRDALDADGLRVRADPGGLAREHHDVLQHRRRAAKLLEMGMEEGMTQAMGQMDAVLADLRSFAADLPTLTQILSDTQVRVSRVIRGPLNAVWRAHHEPELLQKWLLGPDGWTMPVCEVATAVGDSYRYEWEKGEDRFGFEGELLASSPPYRSVTTERMIGMPGEGTTNELTLTPVADGTLLSLLITYPDAQLRDTILATGMTDGMETSYRRLETEILVDA